MTFCKRQPMTFCNQTINEDEPTRLDLQSRGLLDVIEVGDWVVGTSGVANRVWEVINLDRGALLGQANSETGWPTTGGGVRFYRLATPLELLEAGIIDEIPDIPMKEIQKDVFEALENREGPTLFLHGCNAQGGMGAGVARIVKAKFPQAYQEYREACLPYTLEKNTSELLGQVFFSTLENSEPTLVVANAITQEWYGRDPNRKYASAEAIQKAVRTTEDQYGDTMNLVAVRVGAGFGGLDWGSEVMPIFANSSYQWTIYYL